MKQKRKGRWARITARVFLISLLFFIAACFVFDYFVQFRMSDDELNKLFRENNIAGTIHYYNSHGRTIRYVSIGSDTLPSLFMIHGSPSSLSIYSHYFTDTAILSRFRLVAIDRPGYGNSGFGDPEPSIKKQSDMLWPALAPLKKNNKTVLIVGGSYGTSVACRLAMDHPQALNGLMLVAPSLAPGEERIFWFSRAIEHPLLRWFIPRMFQSANTEKLNHEASLTEMLPYWKNINVPVSYLQGANDQLIYTTNATFAKKMMVNVPHLQIEFLKDRPHFFAFTDRLIIRQKILDLFELVENDKKN